MYLKSKHFPTFDNHDDVDDDDDDNDYERTIERVCTIYSINLNQFRQVLIYTHLNRKFMKNQKIPSLISHLLFTIIPIRLVKTFSFHFKAFNYHV